MKVVNNKHIAGSIALIALIILSAGRISAQQSPLNLQITAHAPGISIKDALLLIGEESGMNFSYNSSLIDNEKRITLNANQDRLESVLDDILQEDIQYKVVGNHIVLLADNNKKVKEKELQKSGYAISGTIYDASTGEVIRSATIYDVDGERTGITNNEGFYSILIPSNDDTRGITYAKEGYIDTVIIIQPAGDLTVNMQLNPKTRTIEMVSPARISLARHPFDEHRIVDAVIPAEALSHSNNLLLYERQFAQVSFLPFPGTHTSMNGLKTNMLSLNILAGYTGGVKGIEIGGILNVDRNYVDGLQVAGFGNIVGKKTRGLQVAGFTNVNIGSITGVQVAGFNNVTNDTITGLQIAGFTNYLRGAMNGIQAAGFYNHLARGANGVQAAGFVNFAGRDFKGAQVAGFVNVAIDSIYGVQVSGFANFQRGKMIGGQLSGFANVSLGNVDGGQVAGFVNVSTDEVKGAQVAGFANVSAGSVTGAQVAGFCNYATEADSGMQVAGFMNISAKGYKGIQAAGFLNRAGNFSGLQVGVINISEASSGYSIGLFNFVRKGYRAFEVSADEVLLANFTFKTGNNKLYNTYHVGIQPFTNTWGVGIGLGAYQGQGRRIHIFEEISTHAINENSAWENGMNLQNKFSLGVDVKIAPRLALFAAASYNVHLSNRRDLLTNEYSSKIALKPFYDNHGDNLLTQMWIGGKIGFQWIIIE